MSRSLVPGGAGSGGAADSRAGRRYSNFGALHAAANFTSGRRKQLNYKLQLQLNSFDDSSFYTYGTLDGRAKRCSRYIVQHPSLHRDHKLRSWAAGDLSIWSHSEYGHHTAVGCRLLQRQGGGAAVVSRTPPDCCTTALLSTKCKSNSANLMII